MKRMIVLLCLLCGWLTYGNAQGIAFRETTFEAACQQAASEGKQVFMDCYTSWCGPCRLMATKEFVKPEAGAYFNGKFVCVKYDMEHGEGVQLKERFRVTVFPTFLILNPDGTEVGRLTGASELLPFIEKVEYLLKPENSLSLKKERFKAGEMSKQEMMEYVDGLFNAMDFDYQTIADSLFNLLNDEERMAPEYWNIFKYRLMFPKGRYFNYLEAHQSEFAQSVGKDKVDELLDRCYRTALITYTNATMSVKKFGELDWVLENLKKSSFKNKAAIEEMAKVAQARCQNDAKILLKVLTRLMDDGNTEILRLCMRSPLLIDAGVMTPKERKAFVRLGERYAETCPPESQAQVKEMYNPLRYSKK